MTRFDPSNYTRISKLDKSEYNAIKKGIFSIFQTLGKFSASKPVAYDSSYGARVPQFGNLTQPAFPQCLQWLRDHQREDGSWGEDYPPSIHSKILNTLAGVLAFSQWKLVEDEERIRKGVAVLWILAKELPRESTENSSFEMLLSALVDDGRTLGLDLPYESYEWFVTIGRQEVEKIRGEILTNKPNQHWAILEAAGKTLDIHPAYYRSEIKRRGLIAAQPATTAFVLRQARLKGEDMIEAEWALEKLSAENGGGLPHLLCDNFDLIHGLDFLTKVGVNPFKNDKHAAARHAIEIVTQRWSLKSGIGCSSTWPFPDSNCTEVAAGVLNKTSNSQATKKTEKLSKLAPLDPVDEPSAMNDEPFCLKSTPFSNIRCVSKYYHFMRTVYEAHPDNRRPLSWSELIESQNCDGGWGRRGISSAEETAYVCLAIFEHIRYSSEILCKINFPKLLKYIQSVEASKDENLWHWKVSFTSPGLVETAVTAAKYVGFQLQRICIITEVLNGNKLDFSEVVISNDSTNKVKFRGNVLRFDLTSWPENTENRQTVVDNLLDIFFKNEDPSPNMMAMIKTLMDFSYLQHPSQVPLKIRTIEVVGLLLVTLIDDVVDILYPGRENMVDRLEQLSCSVVDVLTGKNRDPASLPTFDFPDFPYVVKFLFFLQNSIREEGWNCKNFVEETKNVYDVNIMVREDLRNDIELTAKRYLQIHKISTTLKLILQQTFMIVGIPASSESENLDVYNRFLDSACKASRLSVDFPSVLKDRRLLTVDNYCLRLEHQYKVPIREALVMTVKKTNKEILKMQIYREIMLNDPRYRQYTDLPTRMKYVEICVYATHIWGLITNRYACKWTNYVTKIEHERKDETFVRNLCFDF